MNKLFLYQAVFLLLAGAAAGQEEKAPVPAAADQARARNLIRELFKPDYARQSNEGRKALAKRLLSQVADTKDDPVSRYVLLTETVDLASSGGDAETLVSALDLLAGEYAVDGLSLRAEAYAKAKRTVRGVDAARVLGRATLDLAEEALLADHYDIALAAARDAASLGRSAKDSDVSSRASEITKVVPSLKRAYGEAEKARAALAMDPDDAGAHLTLGRYCVFSKDDWDQGLPHLAKGSDATLKLIAGMELRNPETSADRMALGDRWSNLAQGKSKDDREVYAERALHWYESAMSQATSLIRLQLERKIGETAKLVEGSGGRRDGTIDLLRTVNLAKHTVSGTFEIRAGQLVIPYGEARPILRFPVIPRGNYDLELQFTRQRGKYAIGPILVVGDRACSVEMSWHTGGTTWLGGINTINRKSVTSNSTTRPAKLEDNHRYTLKARVVHLPNDEASITVTLDRKPYLQWKGPVSALSLWPKRSLPAPLSLGWVGGHQAELVIHRVRLKMLSGRAETLR